MILKREKSLTFQRLRVNSDMPDDQQVVFRLAGRLDLPAAIKTANDLRLLETSKSYSIDFSDVTFYEPFAMLYFGAQLRTFRDERKRACNSKFTALGYGDNSAANSYAANMGFFESFGLKYRPSDLQGNTQYRPITKISLHSLWDSARPVGKDYREVLEDECQDIARLLTRDQHGHLISTLSYSLREIFRNTFEHSQSEDVWYAAQYWQEKELVELSILDQGIGIKHSIQKNPHISVDSDSDAIQLAILPGISGAAFKGSRMDEDDPWANSGYGLFMTSRLCTNGRGSFFIGSGNAGILLTSKGQTNVGPLGFQGTVVRLVVDVKEVANLKPTLMNLSREGARIAGKFGKASRLTASQSSVMLANEFIK